MIAFSFLCDVHYDYIIVGQGISGTLLSWQLIKEGYRVLVFDQYKMSSSRVASGLINPVTGKRWVTTWMFEELLPIAEQNYTQFGRELGLNIWNEYLMIHMFKFEETAQFFRNRLAQNAPHLEWFNDIAIWNNYFNYHGPIGAIQPCFMVNLPDLLDRWREKLKLINSLNENSFDWNKCNLDGKHVIYENYSANKIIACEGALSSLHSNFKSLPFSYNKGEVLIVSIPDLPKNFLYAHEFKLLPWKDGLFWLGASFEWNYENELPTPNFKVRATQWLQQILNLPFTIVDHLAATRPSVIDYRPIVGAHPMYQNLLILNGTGTKGCLQAPYLSNCLKDYLLYNKPLPESIDIKRFQKK